MFENMVDLMLKGEYAVYVFDTAPTANARRLLGMSKVYSLWVDKMLKSREEARTLREMLSFTKKKEPDPLLEYLLQFRARMGQARQLLTDTAKTAFFFVTLPEALPIAVITRFIGWFHDFGIPVGGVIVNMVLDRQALGSDVPEFVLPFSFPLPLPLPLPFPFVWPCVVVVAHAEPPCALSAWTSTWCVPQPVLCGWLLPGP